MSAFVNDSRQILSGFPDSPKTFGAFKALGCFLVKASYKQVLMFTETLLLGGIFRSGAPETLSGEG
jgi:hypothetical protein